MKFMFLDIDPKKCAEGYVDSQLLRSAWVIARILSWAYYNESGIFSLDEKALNEFPRKQFFPFSRHKIQRHYWSGWMIDNQSNWEWTLQFGTGLMEEYAKMYKKKNVIMPIFEWMVIYKPKLRQEPMTLPPLTFEKYQNFFKVEQQTFKNTVKLYRYYYVFTRSKALNWIKRPKPQWADKYQKYIKNNDFNF